ncbi:MAG: GNAT family N-acetyltransferase [Flavobacteriales bacterium]|nr:GNAT family N-acetyltransferase [Flavobacteriales bacterium]
MRICIAQTRSVKGHVERNIRNHLNFVEEAVEHGSQLIVFPELSITNYEPTLAQQFVTDTDDSIFQPFQELADSHGITVALGAPTKAANGLHISMLFFQAKQERTIYSKQLLHTDELPYFVGAKNRSCFNIAGTNIGFGICYETLQLEHFISAKEQRGKIYITSVAKSESGVEKAVKHFSELSKTYNTPILMANAVGESDNFISAGQSAVWGKDGGLLAQLDHTEQGFIIYDTITETAKAHRWEITKAALADLDALFAIYQNAKNEMQRKGIHQWTDNYPTRSIIENDIKHGSMFLLKCSNRILGAIVLSQDQEPEYKEVDWKFDSSKVLVIHRLAIDPTYQGRGYATDLMDFAENNAAENGFTAIRLDTYSQNKKSLELYKKRGYTYRGNVHFPERELPFFCLEKDLNHNA